MNNKIASLIRKMNFKIKILFKFYIINKFKKIWKKKFKLMMMN